MSITNKSNNPYSITKDEYNFLIQKSHISSPNVFGPGRWDILHSYAKLSTTREQKIEFARFVENVFAPTIKCEECRNEFRSLLMRMPVPFGSRKVDGREWNDNDSSFKWSFSAHNEVNARLKKPLMTWENCLKLYDYNSPACTQCYKPM